MLHYLIQIVKYFTNYKFNRIQCRVFPLSLIAKIGIGIVLELYGIANAT